MPAFACNSEMLTVTDWQVKKNDGNIVLPYRLEAQVTYEGDRAYRMIHAGVMFADVLGDSIGQVNLARDQDVSPGDALIADGQVTVDERMASANRNDIVYRTCVWSIVYQDGTVEKF
jgi:hypothetical protein